MSEDDVLKFWFDHGPDDWFSETPDFDRECCDFLGEIHVTAVRCELWEWRKTPRGRLAEIILLDQLSRQLHRGKARAFACDGMALVLAQEAISVGADLELDAPQKAFLYMPFQHAESLAMQEESVRLSRFVDIEANQASARGHRNVIARFGRFPKRNAALGRESSPDEIAYLESRRDSIY